MAVTGRRPHPGRCCEHGRGSIAGRGDLRAEGIPGQASAIGVRAGLVLAGPVRWVGVGAAAVLAGPIRSVGVWAISAPPHAV